MDIKTVTYKRINNLSNYNSEHLEMTAEIGDDISPEQAAQDLKKLVKIILGIHPPIEDDF